jgi:hypothetical protein
MKSSHPDHLDSDSKLAAMHTVVLLFIHTYGNIIPSYGTNGNLRKV